jgi:hypothetical protein
MLAELGNEIVALSDTITQSYLSHAATTRALPGWTSGGGA